MSFDAAVCIATYRRTPMLDDLLASLADGGLDGREAVVVIVDNDAAGSARSTAERWAERLSLRYEIEREPGIAAARNRALRLAGDVGMLAFVDDDETVTPGWLDHLMSCADEYEADMVAGPVVPRFMSSTPDWVRRGAHFDRPRRATGAELRSASTANLLLTRRARALVAEGFDAAFGLTGGSDTLYTGAGVARGARLVWCDEAVVHETIGPDRANVRWMLRRSFRLGNTFTRVSVALAAQPTRREVRRTRGLQGLGIMARTTPRLVRKLATRDIDGAFGDLRQAVDGAGRAWAGLGRNVVEYRRRPDG